MHKAYSVGIGKISCCRDCTERHEACHGHCEKYLAERGRLEQMREAKNSLYNKDIAELSNNKYYKKMKKGRYKK